MNAQAHYPRVIVIGAGMSGILMGYCLRKAGIFNFTIYEKGDSIGGTWRENNYPGLHCDVPSHHYCYSFYPNPDWSHEYSPGHEIRAYFEKAAMHFQVMPHIQFNAEVGEGRWADGRWQITLKTGEVDVADILIASTGILHVPVYPNIPGLSSFEGVKFHTTRWDHRLVLADKRIGVIGTGSTAVQIVAEISGKVRKLSLFQRTAQWVAKAPNRAYSDKERRRFYAIPFLTKLMYHRTKRITTATVAGIMGENEKARAALQKNVEDNLASVTDPALRARLTPDYEVGCKRLVISPNFYEAVQHPSVELVTDKIDHIDAKGIVTGDGRLHELDLLVLATGFDPTAFFRPVKLYGEGGRNIDEIWAERPIAYHSMTVPHMPNFFMLEGPFSPLSHMSLILQSEWQAGYIMKCIRLIRRRRIAMAPKSSVTADLINGYRKEAKNTVWGRGSCQSYYLDKDGVPIIYPFTPAHFRKETRRNPRLDDYDIAALK